MSLKQRRDHKPEPKGDGEYGWCVVCGDPIVNVMSHYEDRNGHVIPEHWRHKRRWHRMPAALKYPRRKR